MNYQKVACWTQLSAVFKRFFAGSCSSTPDVSTACSPTKFKLFLFSSCITLLVCSEGETKDKSRPALKQDAQCDGGEIRWAKGPFVYPWWSVDVGGLCLRNIQIRLFKKLWYLGSGADKKAFAWTWACCMGNGQQRSSLFRFLMFSAFSAAFRRRGRILVEHEIQHTL